MLNTERLSRGSGSASRKRSRPVGNCSFGRDTDSTLWNRRPPSPVRFENICNWRCPATQHSLITSLINSQQWRSPSRGTGSITNKNQRYQRTWGSVLNFREDPTKFRVFVGDLQSANAAVGSQLDFVATDRVKALKTRPSLHLNRAGSYTVRTQLIDSLFPLSLKRSSPSVPRNQSWPLEPISVSMAPSSSTVALFRSVLPLLRVPVPVPFRFATRAR